MSISSPEKPLKADEILWGLMGRAGARWALGSTGYSKYPTNAEALHYVIDLNAPRLREIDNIVVLGLTKLGTVDQQRANYNHQELAAGLRRTQNVAITRLEMARMIRNYIMARLRRREEVKMYICDHDLTQGTKQALHELGFTVLGSDDLPRYINENSLIYDVTMDADKLRDAVELGWPGEKVPPAAVITHFNSLKPNRAEDVDLTEDYWLSPLMDFTPSVIVSGGKFQGMASGPGPQLPSTLWTSFQEYHSLDIQKAYMVGPMPRESWVVDPMMIMLCRTGCPRPTVIQSFQQQPEYQQEEENWGTNDYGGPGESEGVDEFEEAAGYGGSTNGSYASMRGQYEDGVYDSPEQYYDEVFDSHDGGPDPYPSAPLDDTGHRGW